MNNLILKRPFFVCMFALFVVIVTALAPVPNMSILADNKLTVIIPSPEPTATPNTQLHAAITSYDKAITLEPQNAEAYLHRGNVLMVEDRFTEAITDFNQAISLNPKYAEAYFSLGVALYKRGQYDAAVDAFTQAIKSNSKYDEAYYYRARALDNQGKPDIAIDDYTEAIQLNSAFTADAYYYRAIVFANQGKRDLAVKDLDQTIIIDPDYSVAYGTRGQILDWQGKLVEALKDYQQFVKTSGGPVNPAIFARMKELQTQLGNTIPNAALGAFPLEETFTSTDKSLSVRYPSGWVIISNEPFEVILGNSATAMATLTGNGDAPMSLASGTVGVLFTYYSKDEVPDNWDLSGDPVKFLKSLIAYMPSTNELGKIETHKIGALDTAWVRVNNEYLEVVIYGFFIGKTPVMVTAAAAKGETPQFQPTVEAMIMSLKINEGSHK